MNAKTITIVLADDHRIVREGLQALLESEADFSVVGEAGDGLEALKLVKKHHPDVAVLDMRLPDTDGVELLRRIRLTQPDLPVIITTAYMSIEPQLKVLNLLHSGYIVKPFRLDELGARIDAVL